MTTPVQSLPSPVTAWSWPINIAAYDRTPMLSESERAELERIFTQSHGQLRQPTKRILARLARPIEEVLTYVHAPKDVYYAVVRTLFLEMHQRGTPFWAWSLEMWLDILGPDPTSFSQKYGWKGFGHPARAYLSLIPYLLDAVPNVWPLIEMSELLYFQAQKIFGKESVDQAVLRLRVVLQSWGYRQKDKRKLVTCVSYLLIRNRSPYLEHLTNELLEIVDQTCTVKCVQRYLFQVSRALFALGVIANPFPEMRGERPVVSGTDGSVSEEWLSWCKRWRKQSLSRNTNNIYYPLLKVGRWLNVYHPEVTNPGQWTYELAADFVAAVNDMKVGEWSDASQRNRLVAERIGQPLRPKVKHKLLTSMSVFLRDCQEWGWIAVRINPQRAFRTPRPIRNLLGPNPRVVDKEAWPRSSGQR